MWYSISAEVFAQERNKIMSEYGISQIYPTDRYSNDQVDKLLLAEGIRRDGNLDYTCGMYDDDMNIIATGSCSRTGASMNSAIWCRTARCAILKARRQLRCSRGSGVKKT